MRCLMKDLEFFPNLWGKVGKWRWGNRSAMILLNGGVVWFCTKPISLNIRKLTVRPLKSEVLGSGSRCRSVRAGEMGDRESPHQDNSNSRNFESYQWKIMQNEITDPGRPGNSQADPSVKLRLVNGGSRCAGRVEIHYRGQWGTVYGSYWDLPDEAVVCRELGCGTAVSAPGWAHFGEGTGPVVTADVACSGTEAALRDCESYQWDHYSLSHSDDAGVICSDHRYPRLTSGDSPCSGRLEIQYGENWGTVCDLDWDLKDANVVCSLLQCGVAVSVPRYAHFGEGIGLVRSDIFDCTGNETSLLDCRLFQGNQQECSHRNDASVICSGKHGPRLVDGTNRCSGRVEVLHGDQWGTLSDMYFDLEDANVVCEHLQCGTVSSWEQFSCSHENDASVICTDENWSLSLTNGGSWCDGRVEIYYNGSWGRLQDRHWTLNDANVVCTQLGCGEATAAYNYSKDGESEGPIWVNDVQCEGNELQLQNCILFTLNSSLTDSMDVGVLCSGSSPSNQQSSHLSSERNH
ncbi:deleted in malignant brain tumors 1 protein-like [Heterodontus francisci]|uniref:deleted in malignant brain tumors 1 protein-like n=1 Tax=Heterodontus francisci TaxID=7792 RepID=UPI00355C5EA2